VLVPDESDEEVEDVEELHPTITITSTRKQIPSEIGINFFEYIEILLVLNCLFGFLCRVHPGDVAHGKCVT